MAAAAIPIINYSCTSLLHRTPLAYPEELSLFCDEKSIQEIGKEYRRRIPGENHKEKLTTLLLSDLSGKKLKFTDEQVITEFLDKKIIRDFSEYKTIMIHGWIISVTEARQCALYSLIK